MWTRPSQRHQPRSLIGSMMVKTISWLFKNYDRNHQSHPIDSNWHNSRKRPSLAARALKKIFNNKQAIMSHKSVVLCLSRSIGKQRTIRRRWTLQLRQSHFWSSRASSLLRLSLSSIDYSRIRRQLSRCEAEIALLDIKHDISRISLKLQTKSKTIQLIHAGSLLWI